MKGTLTSNSYSLGRIAMKKSLSQLMALMLVLSMGAGVAALSGCASSNSASASASAASASASGDENSGSDEQADCYGDDLPATKSDKS